MIDIMSGDDSWSKILLKEYEDGLKTKRKEEDKWLDSVDGACKKWVLNGCLRRRVVNSYGPRKRKTRRGRKLYFISYYYVLFVLFGRVRRREQK